MTDIPDDTLYRKFKKGDDDAVRMWVVRVKPDPVTYVLQRFNPPQEMALNEKVAYREGVHAACDLFIEALWKDYNEKVVDDAPKTS